MKRPRAILLDIDNTVYAYAPCHAAAMMAAGQAAAEIAPQWQAPGAFEADYAAARNVVKGRARGQAAEHCRLLYFLEMLAARLQRSDLTAASRLHDAYWLGYFSRLVPDAGCAALLRDLRAGGVRLAWVSDFTTERQMLKLRALGLAEAADYLVTSEEAGADKPDPRVVDLALQRLGADPGETWLIGDDLHRDVGAARARGLAAVWFRREAGAARAHLIPEAVVTNWPELRALWEEASGD